MGIFIYLILTKMAFHKIMAVKCQKVMFLRF